MPAPSTPWCSLGALGFALLPLLVGVRRPGGRSRARRRTGAGRRVVAALGAWRRWSALTVVAALVVVFFVAGGPLGRPAHHDRRRAADRRAPSPRWHAALASTWKQVLTLQPPVGTSGTPARRDVHPGVRRRRRGGRARAARASSGRRRVGCARARSSPSSGRSCWARGRRRSLRCSPGTVLAVVLLPWAAWRSGGLRLRRVVVDDLLLVRRGRGRARSGRPLSWASSDRFVVRDEIVPPFDPRDYPSPLSAFREFVKKDADTPLFTVSGPAGGRARAARDDGPVRRRRLERRRRRLGRGVGGVPPRRRRDRDERPRRARRRCRSTIEDLQRRLAADRRSGDVVRRRRPDRGERSAVQRRHRRSGRSPTGSTRG